MGVAVVVDGVVMAERMMDAAAVRAGARQTQQTGEVLPSLIHAHRAHEGHSTLREEKKGIRMRERSLNRKKGRNQRHVKCLL